MKVVREPRVYLVGRQVIDRAEVDRFLADHALTWQTDTEVGAEALCEAAGRLCYMSFGKGRKTNREYVGHLLSVGHGSVLEHAVFDLILTGVSRSFTHELVRHRAGFGYSQLSQRYVDESDSDFVEPDCIAEDPALDRLFRETIDVCRKAYDLLVERLTERFDSIEDKTLRRKLARQAARSVLPNATETKIFVSGNARGWRHFIELRSDEHADVEIRKVAIATLKVLREAAPNLFGDYEIVDLLDGTQTAKTANRKV